MNHTIDARGKACPQPVILTRGALENPEYTSLCILVDNEAAVANIKRLLKKNGIENVTVNPVEGGFQIECVRNAGSASTTGTQPNFPDTSAKSQVVLMTSDSIGDGDRALGTLLSRGFIYTLSEMAHRPGTLIMMNSAVTLACSDSELLPDLKKLERLGCEILVCGTCLDFYGLTKNLQVGSISNMYSITEALLQADKTLTIS